VNATTVSLVIAAALGAALAQPACAQQYPSKPIRVIVPQAPGSATDVVTRIVGNKLTEALGQSFVVDPRPGAGGSLGTEMAAKSPPDGYTLVMGHNSSHGANPAIYAKLPYDAIRDFAPIISVVSTPYVLTVHPSLPVKSTRELIALAKARPGELNYASAGNGSTHHLSGELFKTMAGIDIVHVPYKGTTPAISGLIAGETSIMFNTVVSIQPHLKSGRLRGLAVTTPKRSAFLPELPTMAETLPGFEMMSWFGLLAPAGTPQPIINTLYTETAKILEMPDVKTALAAQGFEPNPGTPEQFAAFIKSEIAKFTKLAKATNIKVE
jgi:tripartite-type tricarboxylate transporter receptor subunit TctC